MVCQSARATDIHEIERRSHAPWRWAHDCNYLFVCNGCHAKKLDTMPHAEQLAYKFLRDPVCYSLKDWLMIRDPELKAPERVTQEEVDEFVEFIKRAEG